MNIKEALVKHQYDEAQPLLFNLLPNRLVNEGYCAALSEKLLNNCNGKWEKYNATPGLGQSLPEKPGIYMFVWKIYFPFVFDGNTTHIRHVLYIGKAGDVHGGGTIKSRYKSEYSKYVKSDAENIWTKIDLNTRSNRLTKFLNLHELEYWFVVMDKCYNLMEILKIEDELIKLFNPPANKSGVRMKYNKPVNAF